MLAGAPYNIKYALTVEYVELQTREILHGRLDYDRPCKVQIMSVLQRAEQVRSAVWPELRARLSASEAEWADSVESLLALKSKGSHPIIDERTIPDLLKPTSSSQFPPIERFCSRGGYSSAAEVYGALRSGTLH